MTNVELRKQIKDLGGKGYSAMNKAELVGYLERLEAIPTELEFEEVPECAYCHRPGGTLHYSATACLHTHQDCLIQAIEDTGDYEARLVYDECFRDNDDHITNEEEQQMTTNERQVSDFKPLEVDSSSKILSNNKGKEHKPVTDGQFRFYCSMNRNYIFPDEIIQQAPTNLAGMSVLLDKMNTMIHKGEVEARSADEVKAMIESDRKAGKLLTQRRQTESNFPTQKQISWIKDLSSKLNRSIVVPRTKKEASDLIQALDKEYQKSLFQASASQKVAATSDVAPVEKKQSFFQKIVRFFKKG